MRPAAPRANAIQSLRLGRRCGFGRTAVPTASTFDRVDDHVGHVGTGDDGSHPGPRGDLGGGELARHSPAAACGTGSAGDGLERGVDLDDLLDQRRVLVEAGIGGEQPGGVGEQHEHVGLHEVRHERGEPVVVAVADLVVGHGVVLVDDGNHPEIEQAAQGVARVQVLRAHAEVVRGEQHLAREEPVPAQDPADARHEQRLPDRGDGLEDTDVGGAGGQAERGEAGRRSRPSDTSTTWCPRSRASATSAHSLASATSSGSPVSDVIDDDPTFTTAVRAGLAVGGIR